MSTLTLPTIEEIRKRLLALDSQAIQRLAVASDVPFTTIWKIRQGVTPNPGIETVRKFVTHLDEAAK